MSTDEVSFGATDLPGEQRSALQRAVRLEWVTIGYMATCVTLVYLVMGSSQAMKAAWVEDCLAFVPPLAFLFAVRQLRKDPSPEYPYARHRAVATGHLAAAVALLLVGALLIFDSLSGLLKGERAPIGTLQLFGHTVWAGWLMIAVMVYTMIGPIIIARIKMPLAFTLHDRVLYADADMQKADWMTAAGTIVGVLGIGVGMWWADAAVATAIALSIVRDGWRNLKYAVRGLMDGRARTTDMTHTHPLVEQVQEAVLGHPAVVAARVRVRDVGHLLSVDGFVVPAADTVKPAELEQILRTVRDLDWKIDDVVLMPVTALPEVPDPLADRR